MYGSMGDKILEVVSDVHKRSNGKCGITAIKICQMLGVDYAETKHEFNALYESKKFKVRMGINGILLFKV